MYNKFAELDWGVGAGEVRFANGSSSSKNADGELLPATGSTLLLLLLTISCVTGVLGGKTPGPTDDQSPANVLIVGVPPECVCALFRRFIPVAKGRISGIADSLAMGDMGVSFES